MDIIGRVGLSFACVPPQLDDCLASGLLGGCLDGRSSGRVGERERLRSRGVAAAVALVGALALASGLDVSSPGRSAYGKGEQERAARGSPLLATHDEATSEPKEVQKRTLPLTNLGLRSTPGGGILRKFSSTPKNTEAPLSLQHLGPMRLKKRRCLYSIHAEQ